MTGHESVNRRDVLKAAGVAVAGVATSGMVGLSPSRAADDAEPLLIIDCHAHIYGEDEQRYPTIEQPYRPPAGKGTVSHLREEMQAAGVGYATAIQTSTFYRWDNRFTADSSRENKDFLVGVVTLDPDDPGSPELLEKYVREFNVRGMRSIPAASGRLDDPGVERLWAAAERLGIVINVLVNRDKLGEIETLVRQHPDLDVVIDHCLNIKAGPDLPPTLDAMRTLAMLPRVNAKLTFLPTGSEEPYPCRDLHAACRTILEAFGSDRCLWGSNFPCELWCPRVTYAQHLRIFTHELGLEPDAIRDVLGRTAHRLWFEQRRV
ncbi:MAG: amidohydrolase [Planctomycetaceae bacterium]|nr:amidohydrolase [Planctomycetaceae bacterium]